MSTTSELDGISSHYPFFLLNVKPGSCEYQLFKCFGPTRPGNRTQADALTTRLRARSSTFVDYSILMKTCAVYS